MKRGPFRYIGFERYGRSLLLLAGGLLLVYLLVPSLKSLLILLLLILAAAFSSTYQYYFRSPVHFELVKLSAVLAAVAYGFIPGLFVGLVSTFFNRLLSSRMDATILVSMGGIAAVALLSSLLSSAGIFWLGMAAVLLYHLLTVPFQLMMGGSWGYGIVFVGTNIAFNALLFSRVAPFLLSVMR